MIKPKLISASLFVASVSMTNGASAITVELACTQSDMNTAQAAARRALEIGPHDSRLWLVLALLQARGNPADRRAIESLKMSYLTGPNRADLIPARLESVTLTNASSDPDLSELARSDVRAILTQPLEQRQILISDYARASDAGKKFLEESVATIDPKFVDRLRKK